MGLLAFRPELAFADIPGEVYERARKELDCSSVRFEELGGSAYRASGCGLSTTYACVTVSWRRICRRDGELIDRRHKPDTEPKAQAKRDFDEKRKLHFARLDIDIPLARLKVVMLGAPQSELTTVRVNLERPLMDKALSECKSLEVLINGEPFAGRESKGKVSSSPFRTTLHANFDFAVFRPLSRPFSRLGFRGCGQKTDLPEALMDEVRKFFVLFSQIATDVQQQALPPAEQNGDKALIEL